jgi:hypothetical protein
MTRLIVAGGLIPSAWAASPEFTQSLNTTALAHALKAFRWKTIKNHEIAQGPVALCLGHEAFIRDHLGLEQIGSWYAQKELTSPWPIAITQAPEHWWRVDPVHFQLGTDHVTLAITSFTDLTSMQAEELIKSLTPALEARNAKLIFQAPHSWYLQWPQLGPLLCASPSAALGRSVEMYLPQDAQPDLLQARSWRQFCTEVEMTWFNHPVNDQRQQAGQSAVNGLWLQGPLLHAQALPLVPLVEQTYAGRVLEQPYEWVSAINAIPAALCTELEQAKQIELILGGDFNYRVLQGVRPSWWQRPSKNAWDCWHE